MMVDFNTSYYVADFKANRIYLFNINYDYVVDKTFSAPAYIVTVNSSLYITGQSNNWKTDKYLNVLIKHNESGAYYRGIYVNTTENLIYVASTAYTYLNVFDFNLTLKYNVSVSPSKPYSISECNNELYVGTKDGIVLVLVNKVIIRNFTGCSASPLNNIVSNNFGFMAINCELNNKINSYYSNGTYAGTSITTPSTPMYVGFDFEGQFVLISKSQISIYYY
jgi:hypothetical protein